MQFSTALRSARLAAGLTQQHLATLTGIARPNIAAYERNRRQPLITTAETLLAATGASLDITTPVTWHWTPTLRPYAVPSHLWRLPPGRALRHFTADTHLWWSGPPRTFDLSDRAQRIRAYEITLREGAPKDISGIVDGVLLCEAWPDLVLPAGLRDSWQPLIDAERERQPVTAGTT